jgi:membrane protein
MRQLWIWLRDAAVGWHNDKVTRLSSSLAYYALLSLAPFLVLAVSLAALIWGSETASGRLSENATAVLGTEAGKAIESIVSRARDPEECSLASGLSLLVVLVGASGAFGELQSAMNTVWGVDTPFRGGIRKFLRARLFSFVMVFVSAGILLFLLAAGATLSLIGEKLVLHLPGGAWVWEILTLLLSMAAAACLCALIFKLVPDVPLRFRHVWPGAIVSSILFAIGELALGFYLVRASIASPYGAAGSVVVLVVWVYYSTQILLYGAEFTKARVIALGLSVPGMPRAVSSPKGRAS